MSNSPVLRFGSEHLASTTPATSRTPLAPLALGCLLVGSLVLGLAGCGLIPVGVTHYVPEPAVVLDSYDCKVAVPGVGAAELEDPASSSKGSVPDGFVAAGVVRCSQDLSWTSVPAPAGPSPTSEPNTRYTIVEEHFSGDFEPLLTALAQPSDHQDRGECPAMAEIVPDLWLLNTAGKAVHVQWPLTACNFTKPGVMEALADLTVTSSTILHFPVPGTPSEDSTAAGPATVTPASGAAK
ncbi:hypothetical protein [Arthrobacter sp.]|uniref:hypothetical protein n=1 Tax=Arthrobacter sp. TaxID=1667 RepID=UPI0026DF6688|nr:hypothetical protein [Arthrobacter sp.]MDO5752147.1 hypothetical protein [Arthrobacter sp.]